MQTKDIDGGAICAKCGECCYGCATYLGYLTYSELGMLDDAHGVICQLNDDIEHFDDALRNMEYVSLMLRDSIEADVVERQLLTKRDEAENERDRLHREAVMQHAERHGATWNETKGFLTDSGCSLPREARSNTCTTHACWRLEEAMEKKEARQCT